jgi:hypothetical protein
VSVAGAIVAAAIFGVGRVERDWNALAQAALATTAAWPGVPQWPSIFSARRWILRRMQPVWC